MQSRLLPPPSGIHVVLVHPEIPPNTGNIGRLCLATGSRLHLIEPLGFLLDDRSLRRAGLDYWRHVDVRVYPDWETFLGVTNSRCMLFYSARTERSYLTAAYKDAAEIFLVFGNEANGLPPDLLAGNRERLYRIPIVSAHVRSLNLANAASVVVYEALRQRGFPAAG